MGSGALHVRLLDPAQRPEAERLLANDLGSVHLEPDPAHCPCSARIPTAGPRPSRSSPAAASGWRSFSLGQPSLDEVFLALTGRPAEDQVADVGPRATEEEAA